MALKSLVISSTSTAPGPPNAARDLSNGMRGCGRASKVQGVRCVSGPSYLLAEACKIPDSYGERLGRCELYSRVLPGHYDNVNIRWLPQNRRYISGHVAGTAFASLYLFILFAFNIHTPDICIFNTTPTAFSDLPYLVSLHQ